MEIFEEGILVVGELISDGIFTWDVMSQKKKQRVRSAVSSVIYMLMYAVVVFALSYFATFVLA